MICIVAVASCDGLVRHKVLVFIPLILIISFIVTFLIVYFPSFFPSLMNCSTGEVYAAIEGYLPPAEVAAEPAVSSTRCNAFERPCKKESLQKTKVSALREVMKSVPGQKRRVKPGYLRPMKNMYQMSILCQMIAALVQCNFLVHSSHTIIIHFTQ